jgi:hypothetical protein
VAAVGVCPKEEAYRPKEEKEEAVFETSLVQEEESRVPI